MFSNHFRKGKVFAVASFVLLLVCFAVFSRQLANANGPGRLPNPLALLDPTGFIGTFTTNSNLDLTGAFFQDLGANGRTCATCHQPSDAWSVSAAHVKERFNATGGTDPIFRTVDGSNCDQGIQVSTLHGRASAYSLLISRGLIRIALAVPTSAEFEVVSVNNPYGCNDMSTLSMYRRPLPAANLRFLSGLMWDGRESSPQTGTQAISFKTNPGDLRFDLTHQALDATLGHAQATSAPTPQKLNDIVNFETGIFTAQIADFRAGNLQSGDANGGPAALAAQQFFVGINDSFPPSFGFNPSGKPFTPNIFNLFDSWLPRRGNDIDHRASIARGEKLFNSKPINISGVAGLNDALATTVVPGTCGTCHDSPNAGNHSFPAALNIGVGDVNSPLDVSYLPVITLRNKATQQVVQTTDPGRALITGLWTDIGKVKGPILRGLSARAPYFHNGSANSLIDVLDFYDRRFGVGFTDREKADLVAFMNAL